MGICSIGIDVGSTLVKGIVLGSGSQLSVVACQFSVKHSQISATEYDPALFWTSFQNLVQSLVQKTPKGSEVHLGLSVQRSTLIAVDKQSGKALSPIISWQDLRGAALLEKKRQHFDRIQQITGLRPNAHYGASKILRIAKCELRNNTKAVFLPLGSWLVFKLEREGSSTTTFRIDPTLAQRTMLMDIETLQWSKELCRLFGIPVGCLPVIQPSVSDYGSFVCKGRTVRIKVLVGDQQAAFASGLRRAKAAFLGQPVLVSLGTGGFVLKESKVESLKSKVTPKILKSVSCGDDGSVVYLDEGTINHVGTLFNRWEELTGWDVKRLLQMSMPSGFNDVFMPAGFSVGSPLWEAEFLGAMQNAKCKMQNLKLNIRQEIVWAMANGVADLVRMNLAAMGVGKTQILLCGGWSRFKALQQAIERRTGCRVVVSKEKDLGLEGLKALLESSTSTSTSTSTITRTLT